MRNPFLRADIRPGLRVRIVLKKGPADRESDGRVCERYLDECAGPYPRIKVRLADGQIGRVKEILE